LGHLHEPGLYGDLSSFGQQDYPQFQIVLGVGGASDPAIEVARRLQTEFPDLDIDVDPRQHGHNRKISSLINMLKHARRGMLVMASRSGAQCLGRTTTRRTIAPSRVKSAELGMPRSRSERICRE
jgi:hypothetical protein